MQSTYIYLGGSKSQEKLVMSWFLISFNGHRKQMQAVIQKFVTSNLFFVKVHIFWEGHKFLRNLHRRFVLYSASQIYSALMHAVEISQNFVAFSEYMNLTQMRVISRLQIAKINWKKIVLCHWNEITRIEKTKSAHEFLNNIRQKWPLCMSD